MRAIKESVEFIISLLGLAALFVLPVNAQKPTKIVVFDASLIDSSLEGEMLGENPEETQRLKAIVQQVRKSLSASGKYQVLDMEPVSRDLEEILARVRHLHDCNNCELPVAKQLGADQSMVMWVQKVSNLILNFNIVIKDVQTGGITNSSFVDIRSNTDKSWQKGVDYMLRNRILKVSD